MRGTEAGQSWTYERFKAKSKQTNQSIYFLGQRALSSVNCEEMQKFFYEIPLNFLNIIFTSLNSTVSEAGEASTLSC